MQIWWIYFACGVIIRYTCTQYVLSTLVNRAGRYDGHTLSGANTAVRQGDLDSGCSLGASKSILKEGLQRCGTASADAGSCIPQLEFIPEHFFLPIQEHALNGQEL